MEWSFDEIRGFYPEIDFSPILKRGKERVPLCSNRTR